MLSIQLTSRPFTAIMQSIKQAIVVLSSRLFTQKQIFKSSLLKKYELNRSESQVLHRAFWQGLQLKYNQQTDRKFE